MDIKIETVKMVTIQGRKYIVKETNNYGELEPVPLGSPDGTKMRSPHAPENGASWTDEEKHKLIDRVQVLVPEYMHKKGGVGKLWERIAKELGRTHGACSVQYKSLTGYSIESYIAMRYAPGKTLPGTISPAPPSPPAM